MHSIMAIFKRQPHLTLEEFYEYYEHVHAPIARRLEGLIEYRQYPTRKPGVGDGAYMPAEAPYDAVSVFTFESPEAAEKAWTSDVGKELDTETHKCIDTTTQIVLPVTIRDIVSHSKYKSGMRSILAVIKRQPHLTLEEFYEHYEHVHAPIAKRLEGLIEYRQHPTQKPGVGDGAYMPAEIPYDAASVYTFESPEAAEKAWTSDVGEELDIDAHKCIDTTTQIILPVTIREVVSVNHNKLSL